MAEPERVHSDEAMIRPRYSIESVTDKWPANAKGLKEAAEQVKLPPDRLLALADARMCPHYRVDGGAPLFVISELRQWVARNLLERCDGEMLPVEVRVQHMAPPQYTSKLPDALHPCAHLLREIHSVKSPAGVYFLCSGDEVVYVGQANSVISRIGAHQEKDFDRAYYIPIPATELNNVEGALIRHLRPRLNGRHGSHADAKMIGPTPSNPALALAELGFTGGGG